MDTSANLMVKLVLDNWFGAIKRTDTLIHSLTDEQLLQETAPGRNRGSYLLGHLTAVHDAMLPLLGLGDTLHPELLEQYIKNADSKTDHHTPAQLRQYWSEVNEGITAKFNALTADEWLQKQPRYLPRILRKSHIAIASMSCLADSVIWNTIVAR